MKLYFGSPIYLTSVVNKSCSLKQTRTRTHINRLSFILLLVWLLCVLGWAGWLFQDDKSSSAPTPPPEHLSLSSSAPPPPSLSFWANLAINQSDLNFIPRICATTTTAIHKYGDLRWSSSTKYTFLKITIKNSTESQVEVWVIIGGKQTRKEGCLGYKWNLS